MPNASSQHRPMLRILADIRSGRTPGSALQREDRQAIVEHLWIEGLSAAETALLLDLSDRTIKRDRAAIREQNRITPGEHLARDVVSEMKRQADIAVTRIRRAVREGEGKTVTVHMRIRAEQACFNIHRDLVRTLGQVRYIPIDESRFMNAALLDEYETPTDENDEPLTETQEILLRAFPWLRRAERKPPRREGHEEEVANVKTVTSPLIILALLITTLSPLALGSAGGFSAVTSSIDSPRVAAEDLPTPVDVRRHSSVFPTHAPTLSRLICCPHVMTLFYQQRFAPCPRPSSKKSTRFCPCAMWKRRLHFT